MLMEKALESQFLFMQIMSQILLGIFLLYLPWQIAINPIEGVDLASARIFSLFIFIIWLIESLFSRNFKINLRLQSLCLLVFLFFGLFSLLFAQYPTWGLRKLLFLLSFVPIYFVVADLATNPRSKFSLIKALVLGASSISFLGLIQFTAQYFVDKSLLAQFWGHYISPLFLGKSFAAAVQDYPSWFVNIAGRDYFRAISVFPDPHMLAFFTGMTLPFAISIYLKSKRFRYFWLCFAFILLATNLLTFSRGGYLGLLLAFFFFILWLFLNHRPNLSRGTIIGTGIIFVVILVSVCGPIGNRLISSFSSSEGSNAGRIQTWQAAFSVIASHPMGVGIGNYALEIKPSADYREPIYAHSLYLDIAAETGLISLLFFITFLFATIKSFLATSRTDLFAVAGFLSIIVFAAHSLVENPIFSVHVLPVFLIISAFSTPYEKKI